MLFGICEWDSDGGEAVWIGEMGIGDDLLPVSIIFSKDFLRISIQFWGVC